MALGSLEVHHHSATDVVKLHPTGSPHLWIPPKTAFKKTDKIAFLAVRKGWNIRAVQRKCLFKKKTIKQIAEFPSQRGDAPWAARGHVLLAHPLGEIQGYLCRVLLDPVPAHSIPWLVHRLGRHMELVFMIQSFCGRAWTCAIYWKPLGGYQNLIGKVWHFLKNFYFQPLLSNDLFAIFINTLQCHWGDTGTGMNQAGKNRRMD